MRLRREIEIENLALKGQLIWIKESVNVFPTGVFVCDRYKSERHKSVGTRASP